MRDMARVVTIKDVIPMKNKDKIVAVTFHENGYEVIISKEAAVPGNKLIFIEADSLLPVKPQWEFLRKRCFNEKLGRFLIKPMKMGEKEDGTPVRSWGLAVGLNEAGLTEGEIRRLKPGDDVTEALDILKWEPADDASPKKSGSGGKRVFPKWVRFCLEHTLTRWIGEIWKKRHQGEQEDFPTDVMQKSDETTIQNLPADFLEKNADEEVYVSAKMEGQSCVSSDSIVETDAGQMTIGEIVDGNRSDVKVASFNHETGEKEFKEIEKLHHLKNDVETQWFQLETEDGRIVKITGNDRVYLPELNCYRRVDELNGDEVILLSD